LKNIKIYLLLGVLVTLLTGCFDGEPEPVIEIKFDKPIEQPVVKKVIIVKEKDFVEANYVKDDKSNRVFKNCFRTGSTKVEQSCKKRIKNFLKETPLSQKRNIVIEVHTDKGGSCKKNLAISKKRSYAVASTLFYKEYKYSKVYYNGFGEGQLLYNSESKKANVENRRIVVKLSAKNSKFNKKKYKK